MKTRLIVYGIFYLATFYFFSLEKEIAFFILFIWALVTDAILEKRTQESVELIELMKQVVGTAEKINAENWNLTHEVIRLKGEQNES